MIDKIGAGAGRRPPSFVCKLTARQFTRHTANSVLVFVSAIQAPLLTLKLSGAVFSFLAASHPFEARLLLSHALRPFIKLFALPSRFHLSDRRNLSQRQLLTRTSISTSWIFGATFPVSLQTSKHVNTVQPCIFDCSSSPHDSHRRKRLFTAPIRRSLLCTSKHVCVSWTLHEWTRFNTSPRTGSRTPWNHRQICSLRPMRSSPA
jgi:hypothetical protein